MSFLWVRGEEILKGGEAVTPFCFSLFLPHLPQETPDTQARWVSSRKEHSIKEEWMDKWMKWNNKQQYLNVRKNDAVTANFGMS